MVPLRSGLGLEGRYTLGSSLRVGRYSGLGIL